MLENNEISALFYLIDDPDDEVFSTVTERIIAHGRGIIPNLESLWENSQDEHVQQRIELIIHKLHFRDLTDEFREWKRGNRELLEGVLLVSKYCYPGLNATTTLHEIEKMRRNIWLELNSYLTPIEQANVVSGILYSYYKLKGNEVSYDLPEDFLLTNLIVNKRGNSISNGILYLILCQLLDIPAKAINIPRQFILAYFDTDYSFPDPARQKTEKIIFYLDPLNGHVYSQKDIENYFKRISVPSSPSYFIPLNNEKIISHLLEEYSKCFTGPDNLYKKNDLLLLSRLLNG